MAVLSPRRDRPGSGVPTSGAEASSPPRRRADRRATAGLLSAPLLWLLLFFVVPVVVRRRLQLRRGPALPDRRRRASLDDWQRFLGGGSIYLGLFWKSVRMSLTVSVVVVLLAYPVGYFLALCVRKRKYVLLLLIIAPFLTSYLLRVLAWKVILGDRGVVNSFLFWLHLRSAGPSDPLAPLQPVHGDARARLRLDPVRRAADLREPRQPRSEPARGGGRPRRESLAHVPGGSRCRLSLPGSWRRSCSCSCRRSASS